MAKGSIARKPKKEKVHMSRLAVASMNEKNYGPEPEPDHVYTDKDVSVAITWYSLNCDQKQARSFLRAYLDEAGREEDLARVKSASDSRTLGFVSDGCWIARMISRGTEFVDRAKWDAVLDNRLQRLYDFMDRDAKEDALKPKVAGKPRIRITTGRSPREKQFDRYLEILNTVADAIDITDTGKTDVKFVVTQLLVDEKLDEAYVRDMLSEVGEMEAEIVESIKSGSEFSQRWPGRVNSMRRKKPLVTSIIVQLHDYLDTITKKARKPQADGKPVERKPRRKKPVSIDKLVSRVLFQAADEDLGLQSIDVRKIIGAKELWVYNTKYANLTVYRSLTDGGLSVRGTTLLNYDEDASQSKKIGRKAKDHTTAVVAAGKIQLRRYLDTINATPSKPNGRINENTILLRAVT